MDIFQPLMCNKLIHPTVYISFLNLNGIAPKWYITFRRDSYGHLPPVIQHRAVNYWQGRCCQQLRQRSLHHWQGTDWNCNGQDQESLWEVSWPSRIPCFPLIRRWNRIRLFISADGEDVEWIWKEVKAHIFHLSCPRSMY